MVHLGRTSPLSRIPTRPRMLPLRTVRRKDRGRGRSRRSRLSPDEPRMGLQRRIATTPRSADHRLRFGVAGIGAIENQQAGLTSPRGSSDDKQIVHRIYREWSIAVQHGVGPRGLMDRRPRRTRPSRGNTRTAPSRVGIKIRCNRVHIQVLGRIQLAVRSLQYSDRRLLAIGASAISENGLAELLRNGKFVMNGIESDPVHGSSQEAALSGHFSNRFCSVLRQPGED